MTIAIENRAARRLWLNSHLLATTPTGTLDVIGIIKNLGFVQLDAIQNVARAHHHILWSRNQNYRAPMLDKLLSEERVLFEHFTHDASVLPMEFYPMWRRQFRRLGNKVSRSNYYRRKLDETGLAAVRAQIAKEGPLSTHSFDTKIIGKKEMWSRPPHKLALDHMWYSGDLTTSHRQNFKKFYDLAERVIPTEIYKQEHSDEDQINWLCHAALNRMSFGTLGEIQRFWGAVDATEVKAWAKRAESQLVSVDIETVEGNWIKAFATKDIEKRLEANSAPSSRLRILNPFDPAIRDRNRLSKLFGFEYRIEIFVPAAKRQWGYYVYPILEGDRFIGRIEVKADRKAGTLSIANLWIEKGVKWSILRSDKLNAELKRFARFAGLVAESE